MKNIPTKIYLQIGEFVNKSDDIDFKDLTGISWCSERIHKSDIVYVLSKKKYTPKSKLPKKINEKT